MLRWLLAALHLLALGIGLGAIWVRARGLRSELDVQALRRVFNADALWGAAALLWISTGLWRLFGSLEKVTGYYLQNHMFLTKMGLLLVILVGAGLAGANLLAMLLLLWRRSRRGTPFGDRQA